MVMADRSWVMKAGQIVQTGTPQQILTRPRSEFVADFFGARNIFKGVAVLEADRSRIALRDQVICASTPCDGEVLFAVRPEDAVISRNGIGHPGSNSFPGTVRQVVDRGIIIQVLVDVGFPVVSYSLRKAIADLGIGVGDRVHLSFDAEAVHIIEQKMEAGEKVGQRSGRS
jgi:ABC-type Fe3+/spermidine/putrescine transport system ATPase subunit